MTTNQKYKLELTPYFVPRGEESCDLSASHVYGKFLHYIDDDDYVGASLAKKFLKHGAVRCSEKKYSNNKFKLYYKDARRNDRFKALRSDFFYER
jgi:hypothetical protein